MKILAIRVFAASVLFLSSLQLHAFIIQFDQDDFTIETQFNDVETFSFSIEIEGELRVGSFTEDDLVSINYAVSGELSEETPSGFDFFPLERTIQGAAFISQGSSLSFEIASNADLSDGLQFSELVVSNGLIFVLNAREINTGRFHPALLELRDDFTGTLQNSNNQIDENNTIDFGAEYISDLTFENNVTIGSNFFRMSFNQSDFIVTPQFNDVRTFSFDILFEGNLRTGAFTESDLLSVNYAVSGDLTEPTPSDFDYFPLERTIDGDEFRDQGSSLSFEILSTADLTDGVQLSELAVVNANNVFTFNAREVNTGRFHPALVEISADGSGKIQNSNNQINNNNTIDFGAEYISNLANTRLNLIETETSPSDRPAIAPDNGSSSGSLSWVMISLVFLLAFLRRFNFQLLRD